jgi:hypothetical protein
MAKNNRIQNKTFVEVAGFQPKQLEAWNTIKREDCKYLLYGGAMHGGKALSVNSLVCTPFGFRKMGQMEVGSQVSNPDGGISRVIAVYPQGMQKMYRFTFSDGASARVTGDHLWLAKRTMRKVKRETMQDGYKIFTTLQMLEIFKKEQDSNFAIPLTEPVVFTRTSRREQREVHPYALGVLLGDGCFRGNTVTFTSGDSELVEAIGECYSNGSIAHDSQYTYRIKDGGVLKAQLQRLGVFGLLSYEKHIPEEYMYAPIEDRWELLRGLFDTDGYADMQGRVSFTSTSKRLAEQVQWLVRSLGGKATLTTSDSGYRDGDGNYVECREAHTVHVGMRDKGRLFRLDRKKERCIQFNDGRQQNHRRVVNIEEDGEDEAQCITVDNPNGLFITDDFIVTHNSYFLRWAAVGLCMWFWKQYKVTDVSVGLFSEDYPTLRDRQIEKIAKEFPDWLGVLKSTQNEGHCFFLHPEYGGGRVMLRNLDDPAKYQSTEFAAILVEELTKNEFKTFQDLRTRLRYPGVSSGKFIAATNPGGIGHGWCQKYWILKNSGDPEQEKFKYVQATLDDNKYTTSEYRMQLEGLSDREKRAFRDGDWTAFEGMFFTGYSQKTVIPAFEIPKEWSLVGSLDPGWGGTLSFGLQAKDFEGVRYRIGTYTATGVSPDKNAANIAEWIAGNPWTKGRKPNIIVAGHDAWAKKDRYSVLQSMATMADEFRDVGLPLSKANTDRPNGWGGLNQSMENGEYYIFEGNGNDVLCEQLGQTMGDKDNPNDIQGKGNDVKVPDHALDDARYGNMAMGTPSKIKRPPQKVQPATIAEMGDPDYLDAMFERRMKMSRMRSRKSGGSQLGGIAASRAVAA